MDEKAIHVLLKAKLRELQKQGWTVSSNSTKPSFNSGGTMLVGYAKSPVTGEDFVIRHDGASWVYPESGETLGYVTGGKGRQRIKVTEEEFLRNPNKVFSIFE